MEALDAIGINFGYLISNIVNLLLLLIILRLVAYDPILKMLKQRRERIAEGLNDARKAREALASAEADRQALLDEARSEAQRIVGEARQRAEDSAAQVEREAQERARQIIERAENDARAERELALANLRDQIVSLSIAAANRLVTSGMDDNQQKQVVNEFFSNLPAEARSLTADDLVVITALPLTEAEQAKFRSELKASEVTFVVDPGILGGVVLRAEGQEVDNSFAAQLAALRSQLA